MPAQLAKAQRAVKKSSTLMTKAFKKMEAVSKKVFSNIARYAKLAAIAILGLGIAAVKMAADIEDSEDFFEMSMGNMADSSRKWSDQLAKSLHLSQFEIRETVATFNEMVTSMGMSEKAAELLSQRYTKLSYDLVSYHPKVKNLIQASTILQAGLTGERETLKRLGYYYSENEVKLKSIEMGYGSNLQALTALQKAEINDIILMQKMRNVHGDLNRTLDSSQNIFRALWTQIKLTAGYLGEELRESITDVAAAISNYLIKHQKKIIQQFKEIVESGKSVVAFLWEYRKVLVNLSIAFGSFMAVSAGLWIATKAWIALSAVIVGFRITVGLLWATSLIGLRRTLNGIPIALASMKFGFTTLGVKLTAAGIVFGTVTAAVSLLGAGLYRLTGRSATLKEGLKDYWKDYRDGIKAVTVDLGTMLEAWNLWMERKGFGKAVKYGAFGGGLGVPKEEEVTLKPKYRQRGAATYAKSVNEYLRKQFKLEEQLRKAEKERWALMDGVIPQFEKHEEIMARLARLKLEKQKELNEKLLEELKARQDLSRESTTTYNEMMNALRFEYDMLGEIDDVRERAEAAALVNAEIQNMLGVDRNELLKDYLGLLDKIQEKQASLGHTIQLWMNRAGEMGKNLGTILTNTFDRMADSLADALMGMKMDWKAFGRMFIQQLLAMIIKLQIAFALQTAMGFAGGFGGGGALKSAPVQPAGQTIFSYPGVADGGMVERTGLAKIHKGEVFSGVNNEMGFGNITINNTVSDIVDVEVMNEENVIKIVKRGSMQMAAVDGEYRRAHGIGGR